MHIKLGRKIVRKYGDRCGDHFLHTWDDGYRILYQCTLCGGFSLGQFSEFHGMENDDYYSDYFPVDGPEDAERINAEYDGERIEEEFPEKWLIADPGNPHWREGYSESRKPQQADYDPEKQMGREQLPFFSVYKPNMYTVPRSTGMLADGRLSFSEKVHNQTVQKLIGQYKSNAQQADLIALLMGINSSKLIVPEGSGAAADSDQNKQMGNTREASRHALCFETEKGEQYISAFTQENQIPENVLQSSVTLTKYSLVDLVRACKAFKPPFRGIAVNGFDEKQGWVLSPSLVQMALYVHPQSGQDMDPGDSIDTFRGQKAVLIEDCANKTETIRFQIGEEERTQTDNAVQLLLLHSTLRYLSARKSVLDKIG